MDCLTAWRGWDVYAPSLLDDLESAFRRGPTAPIGCPGSTLTPATPHKETTGTVTTAAAAVKVGAIMAAEGVIANKSDVVDTVSAAAAVGDDCVVGGIGVTTGVLSTPGATSIAEYEGEEEDIDGVRMDSEEDIDGVRMDSEEDIDGVPL